MDYFSGGVHGMSVVGKPGQHPCRAKRFLLLQIVSVKLARHTPHHQFFSRRTFNANVDTTNQQSRYVPAQQALTASID